MHVVNIFWQVASELMTGVVVDGAEDDVVVVAVHPLLLTLDEY